MSRYSWRDNLCCIVVIVIGVGGYGLLSLLGLPTWGTTLLFVAIPILCCSFCILQARRNKKRSERYKLENPPDIPSLENFKYCIRCGAEMEKELKTCTNCGQPFEI